MKAPIRRGPVWVAMAVAVVAMLWIGARPRPTDGVSDDRLYAIASQLKCLQCAGTSATQIRSILQTNYPWVIADCSTFWRR